MRIFRKAGVSWLLFLIFYCAVLISSILFICQLGVSVFFYFSDGNFLFQWEKASYIALKKGCTVGLVLGPGLWIKARLQEHKHSKKNKPVS